MSKTKKKKKKRINSRQKGASHENKVAKLFSEWTNKEFHRTPRSGGLHWQKDSRVSGDIVPPIEYVSRFPFSIEVKAHKKIDFSHLLLTIEGYNSELVKFFRQARRDAIEVNKIPLLCFRYNGLPKDYYFAALSIKRFNVLKKLLGKDYKYRMQISHLRIVIFPLHILFKLSIKKVIKAYRNA